MPGDRWQQLANLRAYLAWQWAHPGKQFLFMGAELGQESEWAEARELALWLLDHLENRGIQTLVRDVHDASTRTPALFPTHHATPTFPSIATHQPSHHPLLFLPPS